MSTVPNPISGAKETPRGPDNPTQKGRGFAVLDLGTFSLATSAADLKKHSVQVPSRGRIVGIFAIVEEATTDADADGTMTAEVNGSAVTGGVVTVADTASATPFTTVGKVFQGTAITAGNTFDANDYVDFAWAVSNAFSDGRARVFMLVEYGLNA